MPLEAISDIIKKLRLKKPVGEKMMNKFGLGLFAALHFVIIGCGGSGSVNTSTPEEAIKALNGAMNARNPEAVWELMSKSAKEDAERYFRKIIANETRKEMVSKLMQVDSATLESMTTKEFFIEFMKGNFKAIDDMAERFGQKADLTLEIIDIKVEGDKATVKIKDPSDKEQTMLLVKEDGCWKFGANPMKRE